MDRLIAEHGGRIANTAGDSVLAEFPSAVDAVQCAVDVQHALSQANQDLPEEPTLRFRIGVHVGDVMVRNGDLLGDGVNIAARLQSLADPGGICLSEAAYGYVRKSVPTDLQRSRRAARQEYGGDNPSLCHRLAKQCLESSANNARVHGIAAPEKPSIAVLPFANMSGDPEQEYFADGVVEDITTALSRVKWFFVIARNSSFIYKGKAVDVQQVGRELGVRYVLEGSIRRAGDRIRITGQLIEAATGAHLWANRFDGSMESIFDFQDQITESVIGAIEPSLRRAEIERARRKRPNSLDAYDFYLRPCHTPMRIRHRTARRRCVFCLRHWRESRIILLRRLMPHGATSSASSGAVIAPRIRLKLFGMPARLWLQQQTTPWHSL